MAIYSDKSSTTKQVSIVTRKKNFSDLDMSLTKHPIRKDITPLKDDNALKNAVKNLVLTNFYERPFQHDKGANLRGLLFEPADAFTRFELENQIKDVLELYEPRIVTTNVNVRNDARANAWRVSIAYTIKGINVQSNVNLPLRRLR